MGRIWKLLFDQKNRYAQLADCYFTLLLRTQTLSFFLLSPSEPAEFADLLHPNSFQLHLPQPPTPLGIQMQELEHALSRGSLSSNQLICLKLFPAGRTGYSSGVIQVSGSWRKLSQTQSASRQPAGLYPGSPASITPIKFGSLAIYTTSSSQIIELAQQYTSLLMVKWVLFPRLQ